MSKRPKRLLLWLLPLALAGAGGYYWWHALRPYESTDNAYLKSHLIPLIPKIGGYLARVEVADNQPVKQGQVLMVIDEREPGAKLAQAEAQRQATLARIKMLQSLMAFQQASIRRDQASVASAQAVRDHSERELRRFESPDLGPAVSEQARDAAKSAFLQSMADLRKNIASGEATASQKEVIVAQVGEAEAKLKADEAAVELARLELENATLRAPADGVVGKLSAQPGQFVRPGTALAYLVPAGELWVDANFKEVQLEKMRPGQAAAIRVDQFPNVEFAGLVDSLAPASGAEFSLLPPENASGNFTKIVRRVPVKILFAPGSDLSLLRPGLSAVVKVRVQ